LENDSKDGTAEEVQRWSEKNPLVTLINEQIEAPKPVNCPHPEKGVLRIKKMVHLRNRVIDEVEKRFTPDVFCFIDIDIQEFSPSAIVQVIEKAPDDWGGLFANGIVYWDAPDDKVYESPFQYDSFAFVAQGDDYLRRDDYVVTDEFHPQVAYQMTLALKKHKYLPCESAFNGIGLYRYEAIAGARYSISQNEALKAINCSLCEHIGFNKKVRLKGYGIYIARDMKVIYHHEQIPNILENIIFDYRGIFALNDDKLPFGMAELKPGMLAIFQSCQDRRFAIENQMTALLSAVSRKNRKHLRWVRILIILSSVELIAFIISLLI
jgi:glycosyltransferase involved in cell wall biosynthesis